MERRPPRTFLIAARLAVLVLASGVYFQRDRLVEAWHILWLRSADEATRLDAAERLAAMRSLAAVPHLIRVASEEPREQVRHCGIYSSLSTEAEEEWMELTPILHAIYTIWKETPSARRPLREGEHKEWLPFLLSQVAEAVEEEKEVRRSAYEDGPLGGVWQGLADLLVRAFAQAAPRR
jgi:hypothetical protein